MSDKITKAIELFANKRFVKIYKIILLIPIFSSLLWLFGAISGDTVLFIWLITFLLPMAFTEFNTNARCENCKALIIPTGLKVIGTEITGQSEPRIEFQTKKNAYGDITKLVEVRKVTRYYNQTCQCPKCGHITHRQYSKTVEI
ncbi:hypothetical protein [Lonepinella sp. BR2271]|uniref:hypothetical protein n=1 Tax=Lonepinella sp. BR2271 TaxID=3434550 RepID=UPI003F6E2114